MASTTTSPDLASLYERNKSALKSSKTFLDGPVKLSYGQLFERVERLGSLFTELDLKIGDRVVIASERDSAVIVLFLALLRHGITAVPVNPECTETELDNLIAATGAQGCLCRP